MLNRGYLYLFLAITLCVFSFLVPSRLISVLLCWIALAALYFAAGYLLNRGEIILKSSRGRIPLYMKLVLAPVLFAVTVYNRIYRIFDKSPPFTEVESGLWVGGRVTLAEQGLLQQHNIEAVLDVTAEFDSPGAHLLPHKMAYFNIPIFDQQHPRTSQLLLAVQWIGQQRKTGKQVLIHCALGQGRSVIVLMAYLACIHPKKSVDEIFNSVKIKRTTAAPNKKQLELLEYIRRTQLLPNMGNIQIIMNPVAGKRSAESDLARINELLSPFCEYRVLTTEVDVSAAELTRCALADGATMVVAAGGDGTVMEVASELAGTGVKLGIIPRGTANALAVCLYGNAVRTDPVLTACHHILSGGSRFIDCVETNDRKMLLLAGIGMEAGMVERADRELKNRWGVLAYLIGGWQQLNNQSLFSAELEVDGSNHCFNTGSLTIANAAPNTSVFAQGRGEPRLDDGLLDVTAIVNVETKLEAIEVMRKLFSGAYASKESMDASKVKFIQGREIHLNATPPQSVVVDGELVGTTPVTFKILPEAILVAHDGEGLSNHFYAMKKAGNVMDTSPVSLAGCCCVYLITANATVWLQRSEWLTLYW